jgi:signal transduction histidine kinase
VTKAWATRRDAVLDVGVALALFALSLTLAAGLIDGGQRLVAFVVAFLHVMPLAVRRRWPGGVLGAMVIPAVASVPLGVPMVVLGPGVLVAIYTFGAQGSRRASQLVVTAILVVMAGVVVGNDGDLGTVASNSVGILLAWWLGDRTRRARLETETARRSATDAARRAAIEERMRIARELHDVVAHSMTAIAVQAGAARFTLPADASEANGALLAIERTSRGALGEMRRLLTVLRDNTNDGSLAPAPGLADMPELVETAAHAGVAVDMRIEGQPRDLPAGLELCAYRVVQEALTNVRKHARTNQASVRVRYDRESLRIEVADCGVGGQGMPGQGHGLLGMHERVSLYGGQLEAGPASTVGFRVVATFPLAEDA